MNIQDLFNFSIIIIRELFVPIILPSLLLLLTLIALYDDLKVRKDEDK